jgi:hypothetical protein
MGMLRPGDDRLHYSDNSHRWIAPPKVDQAAWDAGMRAHLFLHVATMGGGDLPTEATPSRVGRVQVQGKRTALDR